MRKTLDLTGVKFGKLIAISSLEKRDKDNRMLWVCKCDCGNTKIVKSNPFSQGLIRSCGKSECRPNFVDFVGKKYGKLIVESFYGVNKRGSRYWNCKCNCEKKCIVSSYKLKKVKNIGCSKECSHLLPNNQSIINRAYEGHLHAATLRNIKSHLTLEQYVEVAKMPCSYCKGFSIRKNRNDPTKTMPLNSVDRKDNENYYKTLNIQSCCFVCQSMKSNMSNEEFLQHINKINKALKL